MCKTFNGKGKIFLTGEVTSNSIVDIERVVKKTLRDIGYNTNYEITNCPRKFENNILNIQETCNVNIIEKSNKEKEKEIKMSIKQNLENKINDNEKLFEENSELKNQELLNSSNKKISSGNKSKRSSNKITMEIKTKIPQSNELLFNPRN